MADDVLLETVLTLSAFASEGSLLDRQSGERAGAAILERMRHLPPQGLLIVDCQGVRYASYPSLVGILSVFLSLQGRELRDRYQILRVHSDQGEFSEAMEHVTREIGVVVPRIDEEGRWRMYGKLTAAEAQTMGIVQEMARAHLHSGEVTGVTAAALSERLRIPVSAASNRLKHLFDHRLIRREERLRSVGGREYWYWPLSANG